MIEQLVKVALLGSTWVLYLLFALSVISMVAMLERWLFFRKNGGQGEKLREALDKALDAGDIDRVESALRGNQSIQARALAASLRFRGGGPEAFSDGVEGELGKVRGELNRGMTFLGTLGNNAPFVGLLGTVIGVIEAFQHLGGGQSAANMSNVMSGIAEALVATGVGLFVALPAVVAYNVAQKKVNEVESETTSLSKLVTAFLKARTRRERGRPGTASSGADDEDDGVSGEHEVGGVGGA